MKIDLYSIHDRLAGTYSAPIAIPEKIVMRQLQYIISDMTRLDVQDKEAVKLGEMDNETGIIYNEANGLDAPTVVADLSQLKAQMEERAAHG